MSAKAELTGKLNKEKMMPLNCNVGENCWEYHGLQEPDEVKTDNFGDNSNEITS